MIMENKKTLHQLWDLLNLDKSDLFSIYFYAILGGLVELSVPIGIQAIISFVLGASMVTSIYILIFLVVIGVFGVGVFQVNQMKVIEKIQQRLFTHFAFEFSQTLPQIDLYKADLYYLPEKVNRFFDTLNIQKGIQKLLLDIPIAVIQIFLGLILLALYHPLFILFGFILVVIFWLIIKFTGKNGLETSLEESNYKYQVVAWFQEIARTIRPFKFSQNTNFDINRTDKLVTGYLTARTSHFRVLVIQYKSLIFFKVIITATLLSAGVYLLISQVLNIGEFIAAEIVIIMIINSTEKIIKSLESVYDVLTGIEKLASVTSLYKEQEGNMQLNSENIAIELKDFTFQYPNTPPIFKDLNLKIEANSKVCISGDEASGKTSMLKVLSLSYGHYKGNLLVNSIPIINYNLQSIRSQMGIYLQSDELFSGTVWENIALGKPSLQPASIIALAGRVGFSDFLQNLPLGFETKIHNTGKRLPSSITKKILLLRALAENPSYLLLEEPFLGLEKEAQEALQTYLLEKNGATTVIISNDESYKKRAEQVIVMNHKGISISTKH
jgi:ATP-binding cassette subfamily B protein